VGREDLIDVGAGQLAAQWCPAVSNGKEEDSKLKRTSERSAVPMRRRKVDVLRRGDARLGPTSGDTRETPRRSREHDQQLRSFQEPLPCAVGTCPNHIKKMNMNESRLDASMKRKLNSYDSRSESLAAKPLPSSSWSLSVVWLVVLLPCPDALSSLLLAVSDALRRRLVPSDFGISFPRPLELLSMINSTIEPQMCCRYVC
jgi:hypothetical protein